MQSLLTELMRAQTYYEHQGQLMRLPLITMREQSWLNHCGRQDTRRSIVRAIRPLVARPWVIMQVTSLINFSLL